MPSSVDSQIFLLVITPILIFSAIFFSIFAAVHAAINKRNARAAFVWVMIIAVSPMLAGFMFWSLGWLGLVIAYPFISSIAYLIIGINRLPRKWRKMQLQLKPDFEFTHQADALALEHQLDEHWQVLLKTNAHGD